MGGFELGLNPDGTPGAEGPLAYWGVANIQAEADRVTGLGGVLHDSIQDVGGGIRVASVRDPFGNRLGLIENPHFRPQDVR